MKSLGKYTIYQNKNSIRTFQYFKAESVILGKTLILKLVDFKSCLISCQARQVQKINES